MFPYIHFLLLVLDLGIASGTAIAKINSGLDHVAVYRTVHQELGIAADVHVTGYRAAVSKEHMIADVAATTHGDIGAEIHVGASVGLMCDSAMWCQHIKITYVRAETHITERVNYATTSQEAVIFYQGLWMHERGPSVTIHWMLRDELFAIFDVAKPQHALATLGHRIKSIMIHMYYLTGIIA